MLTKTSAKTKREETVLIIPSFLALLIILNQHGNVIIHEDVEIESFW